MPIRKQYTTRRARSRRQKYRTGGSKTKSSSNRKRSPSSSSSPSTTKRARMESPPAPITVTAPNLVKGKHYTGPSMREPQKVYGVVKDYPNDGVTQIYVIDKHGNSSYKTVSNEATYTEEKNVKKEVFAKELQVGEIYKALSTSSKNAQKISGKEILQKSCSYDKNQIKDVFVQVERDGPMIKLNDDDKFYEYSDDILPFMNREELLEFHDAICKSNLNNSTATVFGNPYWIRELCEYIEIPVKERKRPASSQWVPRN